MRLFFRVLWLTLKQGGRRVLPFLCCLLAALLALSALPPAAAEPAPLVRVGLLLHDQNPLTRVALNALLGAELDGLFELVAVDRADPFPDGCDALLEVPDGFFESIMTGENRPPRLTLRVSSPVEALVARQMALTASSVLGAAQRAVSVVLPRLEAAGLPGQAQDALVLSLDLALFDSYLSRHALLSRQTVSATGALDPARHYALSLLVLLALALAFLHQPTAAALRPVARPLGRPLTLLGGWAVGTLLLTALLLAPAALLVGGVGPLLTGGFWLAVLLLGCLALPLGLVARSAAGTAGVSIGLAVAMGLLGGGFWPPALTPPALLAAGRPLPFSQAVSLLTVALTGGEAAWRLPLLWCVGLAALTVWLWLRRDGATPSDRATTDRPDDRAPGPFFPTALALGLKRQLRAPAFWACGLVLLALLGGLAALYPRPQPLSLAVGVLCDADGVQAVQAVSLLEQNDDFALRRYDLSQRAALERDLRAGRLHCAYRLDGDAAQPVVSLATEAALLRPVVDELVLTAWFEAGLPAQLADLLAPSLALGPDAVPALAEALAQDMAATAVDGPAIALSSIGTAAPLPEVGLSVAPLLYAVLITAFLLAVALGALLAPADGPRALALLGAGLPWHRRAALALAQVAASALLYAGLLMLAEGLVLLCGVESGYSAAARLVLPLLLAPLGALLGLAFLRCARRPMPLLLSLPAWALGSVLLSGALLDPARLGGLGALRFLSPAWWLLRLMTRLS